MLRPSVTPSPRACPEVGLVPPCSMHDTGDRQLPTLSRLQGGSFMPDRGRNQRIGLSGEYYVAAELNRRGVHTVTFTGNIPDIDAVAVTPRRRAIFIQVKTQQGRGWPVAIDERLKRPSPNIVWVLVELRKGCEPKYWIIPDRDMRAIMRAEYEGHEHEFESKAQFAQLTRKKVAGWEDRWDFLTGGPAS